MKYLHFGYLKLLVYVSLPVTKTDFFKVLNLDPACKLEVCSQNGHTWKDDESKNQLITLAAVPRCPKIRKFKHRLSKTRVFLKNKRPSMGLQTYDCCLHCGTSRKDRREEKKRSPFHVLPSNGHWPNIWPISRRLGALHSSPKLIWLQLPSSRRYWFTACGLRLWWDCKRSWKLFWDKWYLTVTK